VIGPSTPPPADPDGTSGERRMLVEFLDYYRTVLVRKAEGLSDDQARAAACPPSDLTILGLVRHMAEVERGWFRRGIAGEDAPPRYHGASHPDGDEDGDLHPPPDATLADALAVLAVEVEAANTVLAAVESLDRLDTRTERPTRSVRWILVHMVEEYARHCGHADLLRQALDGAVGD
jgi:uncharacterized damage-inducible protein DinB